MIPGIRTGNVTGSLQCRGLFLITGVLVLILGTPSTASANIPVPSLYGFGAPFFLSVKSLGLLFLAILLIEGVVFRFGVGLSWKKALLGTLVVNLVSGILGVIISKFVYLALVVSGILYWLFVYKWTYSRPRSFALALLPLALSVPWALLTHPEGRAMELWTVYASLVLGFCLSVVIEAAVFRPLVRQAPVWRGVLLANGASYVLLIVILIATSFSQKDNPMMSPHYLLLSAASLATAGQADRAMQVVDAMHELSEGHDSLRLQKMELEVASILAKKGHRKNAEIILDRVLQTPRDEDESDAEIQRTIDELQTQLAQK
jgi:hypothetical protein